MPALSGCRAGCASNSWTQIAATPTGQQISGPGVLVRTQLAIPLARNESPRAEPGWQGPCFGGATKQMLRHVGGTPLHSTGWNHGRTTEAARAPDAGDGRVPGRGGADQRRPAGYTGSDREGAGGGSAA